MRTSLLLTVLTLLVLFGSSPYLYAAFAWLNGDIPWVTIEAEGSTLASVNGPNAPQHVWMPKEPRAVVASANRWQPSKYMKDGGGLDVVSRRTLTDVKAFYSGALRNAGFRV